MPHPAVLPKEFFLQDVWTVAQSLLGKVLVVLSPDGEAAVRITETEAYGGISDKACHAYGGRRTKRTEPMFAEGGTLYVYKCYGLHNMLNIVTGPAGDPCAVLIRAGEPLWGLDLMRKRRKHAPLHRLTVGPGALSAALNIPLEWSGRSILNNPQIFLYDDGYVPSLIAQGTRIGVEYAGEDAYHPWRYWIADTPFVSHIRKKVCTFDKSLCQAP